MGSHCLGAASLLGADTASSASSGWGAPTVCSSLTIFFNVKNGGRITRHSKKMVNICADMRELCGGIVLFDFFNHYYHPLKWPVSGRYFLLKIFL